MKVPLKKMAYIIFFFSLPFLNAQEFNTAEIQRELGFFTIAEYNRAFMGTMGIGFSGAISFNNRVFINGGMALSKSEFADEIYTFGTLKFSTSNRRNFYAGLSHFYFSMPMYHMQSHSLFPFFSYDGRRSGFTAGINIRSSIFFYEAPIQEMIMTFRVYYHFINNGKFLFGIQLANFSDFHAGNFGSMWFALNGEYRINSSWLFYSELRFLQSGVDSLSATIYGIVFSGGLKYSW